MSTDQLPGILARASLTRVARFMLFWDTDRVEVFDARGRSLGILRQRDLIRALATDPGFSDRQAAELVPVRKGSRPSDVGRPAERTSDAGSYGTPRAGAAGVHQS